MVQAGLQITSQRKSPMQLEKYFQEAKMKTQEINAVKCVVTYRGRDVVECQIECTVTGQRWHSYGRSKPAARASAIDTMRQWLRDGYTGEGR